MEVMSEGISTDVSKEGGASLGRRKNPPCPRSGWRSPFLHLPVPDLLKVAEFLPFVKGIWDFQINDCKNVFDNETFQGKA
ncbi:hypothetical protein QQP08_000577 [Theobroma cacao]|nr:hypothetical protein QQP08_000577 [Theobroma cacao]